MKRPVREIRRRTAASLAALLLLALTAMPAAAGAAAPAGEGGGGETEALRAKVAELESELVEARGTVTRLERNVPLFWNLLQWVAQVLFFSRFLVQWLASEKMKRSVIPHAFWYISIAGGMGLLAYSSYIYHLYGAALAIAGGQAVGLFVYTRNLALIRRAGAKSAAAGSNGSI